jgi:hypothetical protein
LQPSEDKHERIWFRRDEIVPLSEMPSAAGQDRFAPDPHLRARVAPIIGWTIALILIAICAIPAALFVFGVPGVGGERLRTEAEAALTRLAGIAINAESGNPRLSIDGSRFLGVQIDDLSVSSAENSVHILDAGTVRFGLRFLPLLSGNVQLGSAGIEDARISLAALPRREGASWMADVLGPDGLAEPALVLKAVFRSLHRAFDSFEFGATKRLDLTNVEIVFPPDLRVASMMIETARIERTATGEIAFEVQAQVDGRKVSLAGSAVRDGQKRQVASLDALLTVDPTLFERTLAGPVADHQFAVTRFGGGLTLALAGNETDDGTGRLSVKAGLQGAELAFANGQVMTGDGNIAASFDAKGRKIEIEKGELTVGRSRFLVHGAIGPAPAVNGQAPDYRYEIVSDRSVLAPGGSTEPDLPVIGRIAGAYDPATRRLTASEIGVRTGRGEVIGTAIATFVDGKSPGIDLALSIAEMPVSHAKQLWPWLAASGAYRWANANLFGGTLRNSQLSMSVAPGRIGSGIALTEQEISGVFDVANTRFDITGQIPPVRDGVGSIRFQGTDVDVTLKSGTVYLPTGRTVAASDGTFVIRRGEKPPVIGELDINIAGSADAVAEFASYKPIDAMRHLDIAPDELTGDVTGNVKARIPLQARVELASLGWTVKLAYTDLAISKPFQGQTVTDADGTIEVVPTLALVKAKARLNGMQATLDIAEPLGRSEEDKRRDISLVMDDKARAAIAPGLETILTGPVTVKLSGEGETKRISADLADAKLNLPWVGWSKGAGVAATVTFDFDPSEGDTRINNLKLSGQSFSLTGSATVGKSGLSRARFENVKLNRNDDISVDVRRAGSGYVINVRGKSLDARSLIKQVLSEPEKVAASGPGKAASIALDAEIDYVSGFDGEALSNVKIAYQGSGARIGSLKASGSTRAGGALTIADGTESGRRTVKMQSADAGAVLRFMDIYPYMQGGRIAVDLTAQGDAPLKGQIDARDFQLVDEPRLRSIVSTAPTGDTRSLNQAVRADLDTSRVRFERGFARVEKGKGYLSIDNGVLRGPEIGTTFQGSLYDAQGNMAITGTFMPAYGLNRLFGEIPLLGQILGNGRDRGLIGITYKVAGKAKSPQVQVNPISAIAPGIFRSIFEFN